MVYAASTAHSKSNDDAENVCRPDSIFPLETDDIMSDYLKMLYVDFSPEENKDNRGRELKFSASKIKIIGDHIEFENPSLNERPIHSEQMYCASKKKNIFGIEVCQNDVRGAHLQFCKKLGLEAPNPEQAEYTYARRRDSFYYSLGENGSFYSSRISMLAGSPSYRTLYKFKCKIPK